MLGEEQVEDELGVERPVAGVGEDEDEGDAQDGWVVVVVGGERERSGGGGARKGGREGPHGWVGGEDVRGGDDVAEAVPATRHRTAFSAHSALQEQI